MMRIRLMMALLMVMVATGLTLSGFATLAFAQHDLGLAGYSQADVGVSNASLTGDESLVVVKSADDDPNDDDWESLDDWWPFHPPVPQLPHR